MTEKTNTELTIRVQAKGGMFLGPDSFNGAIVTVYDDQSNVLAGPAFDVFPNNRLGDGVNVNDMPVRESFPYVALAHDGRNSRHIDPDEPGCGAAMLDDCPVP